MAPRSPNPIDQRLGRNIRFQRLAAGLSQEALAHRLGLTFQQVQKYEKGTNRVSANRLVELASIFGIDIMALLDGVDVPTASADRTVSDLLETPRAIELLRVFSCIEDNEIRAAIVDLVNELGRVDGHALGNPLVRYS
jgi:transcriptional regulator with XRE-family HTH domain